MTKFSGNGTECVMQFIKNGNKGTIEYCNLAETMVNVLVPNWLLRPCTYTTPEPMWQECTPGAALDAGLEKVHIQRGNGNGGWESFVWDMKSDDYVRSAYLHTFIRCGGKFRKEATT